MSQKVFPIKTDTACRLKWAWSTLYLNNGRTGSCHRSAVSDIPEIFDSFHNTDIKIKHRQLMLQHQWPGDGCEYCRDVEDVGGFSDRQFQNQIPDVYPLELDNNPTLTNVAPTILEVFFSNTCNLSCVYCTPKFSSSIQAEHKKFGGPIIPGTDFLYQDNQYKALEPKFWEWMRQHARSLQRLQILGGEPFLQKDTEKIFDFFESTPCPELELNFVTNLTIPEKLFDQSVKKINTLKNHTAIKRIDIQASIDCWSPAQEYIRHGINLDLFEKNINKLMDATHIRIGLISTITSLSISTLPELAVKRNTWCQKQNIFWYPGLVLPNNTSVFDPSIFDFSVYESSLDRLRKLLPQQSWDDFKTIEAFDGIILKLKNTCRNNTTRQKHLLNYLNQNDQRRNISWKTAFPWLEKEFEKNNVV